VKLFEPVLAKHLAMWLEVWIGRPHTDDFVSFPGGKDVVHHHVEEQVQKIERQ